MATSSSPARNTAAGQPTAGPPSDSVVGDFWRTACEGLSAPWLDEIASLRVDADDLEASLDIWFVALTAALKDPDRRETASRVLARLQRMSDADTTGARGDADA